MNRNEYDDLVTNADGPVQFVHAREAAALIESLGYTDQSARGRGFTDVFSLAEHLFARLQQRRAPDPISSYKAVGFSIWAELGRALRKSSMSLAYILPWMVMLVLEYLRPTAVQVSPEMGAALSLSLMCSLISTGGFVQMISRAGNFYYGLKEPGLTHRICLSLLNIGLTCCLVLALLGMIAGSYFHIFASNYLVLAAITYIALSILWMLCAVLSAQGIGWCIPFVFSLSILIGSLMKVLLNTGTTILFVLCPLMTVSFALTCVLSGFYQAERKNSQAKDSVRPRGEVMFISLVPFYIYGTFYFSFLFADRLTAGSAVPWVSGLSFGIDNEYKRGTDLVLLAFLITAAFVEYLADSFLRFWHKLATELPQVATDRLRESLRKRHADLMWATFVAFVAIALSAWFLFSRLTSLAPTPRLLQTALFGGLGYLMLCVALLEIIILASMNVISMASLAVAAGLAANLIVGYGLSHLWGVQYATLGLLVGGAVVLWISNGLVRSVLRRPDYHYSVS